MGKLWITGITANSVAPFRNDTTKQGNTILRMIAIQQTPKANSTRYQQNNYFIGNLFSMLQAVLPKFRNTKVYTDSIAKLDEQPYQNTKEAMVANSRGFNVRKSI